MQRKEEHWWAGGGGPCLREPGGISHLAQKVNDDGRLAAVGSEVERRRTLRIRRIHVRFVVDEGLNERKAVTGTLWSSGV